MISLYAAMLVTLGFLMAALAAVIILPAYRRRIERFASEAVRRSLPLTEQEIRADKDRLKAAYAMDVHKLESKLEQSAIAAARQSVEINRREARIHELDQEIASQKLKVAEHENARRVLEQAILDRLPKVEQRLVDARKLLSERDADIALLADTSAKQTAALGEATQINLQQSEELKRTRAALDTRAARRRETIGDPRFDGEVALRTEIETLRAKTRDQSALIDRLQAAASETDDASTVAEIGRLRADLAKAEAEFLQVTTSNSGESERLELEARVRALENEGRDGAAEIARLKGALSAYETPSAEGGDAAAALAARAEIGALQAEAGEQRLTIQSLRADLASVNERLARQAQHFRDELRRLATGAAGAPAEGDAEADGDGERLPLAQRLTAPRPPRLAQSEEAAGDAAPSESARPGGFLKAVNGGAKAEASEEGPGENAASDKPVKRRPRLLERLGGFDKS